MTIDSGLVLAFRNCIKLPNIHRQTLHYVLLKKSGSWERYLTYYNIISLFQSVYSHEVLSNKKMKNVKKKKREKPPYNNHKDKTFSFYESGTSITSIICLIS